MGVYLILERSASRVVAVVEAQSAQFNEKEVLMHWHHSLGGRFDAELESDYLVVYMPVISLSALLQNMIDGGVSVYQGTAGNQIPYLGWSDLIHQSPAMLTIVASLILLVLCYGAQYCILWSMF